MKKNIIKDNKGFTLTEVMIAIMILTMAIVSASNILVTMIKSNQVNLTSMQAYYFAQEGLEAVRSIRDTNWLHTQPWLGGDDLGGYKLEKNKSYELQFKNIDNSGQNEGVVDLVHYFPWEISDDAEPSPIYRCGEDDDEKKYFGYNCEGSTPFSRLIQITEYSCELEDNSTIEGCNKEDSILVTSKVSWMVGSDKRDLSLSTVLTDWKGGSL